MTTLIEDFSFHNKVGIFEDRAEAGRLLADKLALFNKPSTIVLAIPSGGVPVGKEIADAFGCDFDLLIVRKAQIPWNTEAGFGAVNLNGDMIINEPLVQTLGLTQDEINAQISITRKILQKREKLFRKEHPFPSLKQRTVILVDDGLASGYTMLVAINFVRKQYPAEIVVAVPTGMSDTVETIHSEADAVVCLNIRDTYPFAVASAYRNWYDLTDAEVMQLLNTNNLSLLQ